MMNTQIEVSEFQLAAVNLLGFWWACIEAQRELDGEPPIPDDKPVLHFCACGATAMVTAGHLRAIATIGQGDEDGNRTD